MVNRPKPWGRLVGAILSLVGSANLGALASLTNKAHPAVSAFATADAVVLALLSLGFVFSIAAFYDV